MITQVVGMGLSFLLMWQGRDRVWTPTFEGTQASRFEQAMLHYQGKMGLEDRLVFNFNPARIRGQEDWCASVEFVGGYYAEVSGFDAAVWVDAHTVVRWYGDNQDGSCGTNKPEHWALHEACHLRMMHHRMERERSALGGDLSHVKRHEEVDTCMGWYSEKGRR
jgi:hypothetical protein